MNRSELALTVLTKLMEASTASTHARALLKVMAVRDPRLRTPPNHRYAGRNPLSTESIKSLAKDVSAATDAAQDYVLGLDSEENVT